MDMKEMVQKVKNKEPLYGVSRLDPYLQGVAARTSTYSQKMLHVIPMFNFVNHQQVSDTAFIPWHIEDIPGVYRNNVRFKII